MPRNHFVGICYRCNQRVEPGEGHFERRNGRWRTQHAECAIAYRHTDARNVARPASEAAARAMFDARESADAR